jgi:WD40 repeat protein
MSTVSDRAVLPDSPYKGLVPFDDSDLDARFFFGRERETELVAANLMASRLTVLYGPSGVGKSSLLRAGVVRRLRLLVDSGQEEGRDVAVIVDRWRDDPVGSIAAAAGARAPGPGESLADVLAARLGEIGGELYLILDQMEEYFLYHGRDGEDPLADELAETLSRPELRVHVLLGIRDDSLSELDAFKGRLPALFANVLRLDHLGRGSARSAVVGPLEEYAAVGGDRVVAQPAFVEAVLDQVATGRIEHGLSGRGTVADESDPTRVEAPYLQLVLERLWEVERASGSVVLRAATLDGLGGADRIVEEHLERALAPLDSSGREHAARLFNQLVTPSGTKIAHSVPDLARYAGDESGRLDGVLRDLASARIVRPLPARNGAGPRYEIFHDVLAGAVLEWRTRHETERALAVERSESQRRHRRLAILAVASLLALTVTVGFAVYAFSERARANDRARTAKARELTVASLSQAAEDPELSLLLALEAVRRDPSAASGEEALRAAYLADHARRTVEVGEPLLVAALRGDRVAAIAATGGVTAAAYRADGLSAARARGSRVEITGVGRSGAQIELAAPVVRLAFGGRLLAAAATDGTVVVVDGSGAPRFRVRLPSRPTALALAPDGSRVAAASGKTTRVFEVASGRRVARLDSRSTALALDVSPGGRALASGSADGAVRLWDIDRGRLVNVLGGHTNQVRAVRFTPDGRRLISAGDDATGRVWRVEDGHVLAVLAGHRDEVAAVTVAPDGRSAVTASADGTARIWNVLGDPQLRVVARVPGEPVLERVDGDSVVVRTGARSLRLDRRTGSVLRRATAGPVAAPIAGWRVAAAGSVARLVRPDGRAIVLRGHRDEVLSVRLSPDGTTLLTASADHDVRLWRASDGAPVRLLKAHGGRVADARFSPDGRWIVTAGPGGAVWSAATGSRPLFYLQGHVGPLTGAAFAPDSRTIVTSGTDGTIRTYVCQVCGSLQELITLAKRRLADAGRTLTAAERRTYLRET